MCDRILPLEKWALLRCMDRSDLAKAAGLSHSTVRKITRNRSYRMGVRPATWRAIAEALQVNPECIAEFLEAVYGTESGKDS
jgi:DNA-binding Xre family transcriptional regulator